MNLLFVTILEKCFTFPDEKLPSFKEKKLWHNAHEELEIWRWKIKKSFWKIHALEILSSI